MQFPWFDVCKTILLALHDQCNLGFRIYLCYLVQIPFFFPLEETISVQGKAAAASEDGEKLNLHAVFFSVRDNPNKRI
jgi:hypothetical protein